MWSRNTMDRRLDLLPESEDEVDDISLWELFVYGWIFFSALFIGIPFLISIINKR